MWEAVAEYKDGSSIRKFFAYRDGVCDNDQQYDIECWLLGRHPGCTYYSVIYVDQDTEE